MKAFLLIFCSLFLSQTIFAETSKIDKVYLMALEKIEGGDYDTAQRYLEAVIKAAPKHSKAQFKLSELKRIRAKDVSTSSRKQLENLIIDKIEFEQVTLHEAIDGFRVLIDQKNGNAPPPNLYILDPNQKLQDTLISLSLNKVPAETALKYIADQAQSKVSFKEFLIEVSPR